MFLNVSASKTGVEISNKNEIKNRRIKTTMSYSFAENSLLQKKEKTVGVKEEGVVGRAFTRRQVKVVQRAEKYEKFSRDGRETKTSVFGDASKTK